jgi:hypothetical protein
VAETGMNWSYGSLPNNISTGVGQLVTGLLQTDVLGQVTESIETALNDAAIAAVNRQVAARCTTITILRPDISLNIMNVLPGNSSVTIEASLSCFGVLLNKLCQPQTPAPNPGGGNGGCALRMVVIVVVLAALVWMMV